MRTVFDRTEGDVGNLVEFGHVNVLVPEWTQATVEKIFATHLEDWPALLRSLRLVGDDVRVKMRKQMSEQKASLQ